MGFLKHYSTVEYYYVSRTQQTNVFAKAYISTSITGYSDEESLES
jgi:hypothetical protein